MVKRLNGPAIARALDDFANDSAPLRQLLDNFGLPKPWYRKEGFATLVLMVLEQQVSVAAAKTMNQRVQDAAGEMTPEAVLALGDRGLASVGLTRQKTATCLGIAEAIVTGSLDLTGLSRLDDAKAMAELCALKGIGPWTAQVYLITALRRPDLFPAGDRALVIAVAEFGFMSSEPREKELDVWALEYAPWRSAMAWMLWHAYLRQRDRPMP